MARGSIVALIAIPLCANWRDARSLIAEKDRKQRAPRRRDGAVTCGWLSLVLVVSRRMVD